MIIKHGQANEQPLPAYHGNSKMLQYKDNLKWYKNIFKVIFLNLKTEKQ